MKRIFWSTPIDVDDDEEWSIVAKNLDWRDNVGRPDDEHHDDIVWTFRQILPASLNAELNDQAVLESIYHLINRDLLVVRMRFLTDDVEVAYDLNPELREAALRASIEHDSYGFPAFETGKARRPAMAFPPEAARRVTDLLVGKRRFDA